MSTVIDHILEELKKRGERLTIQRRVVIEALAAADNHLTIPNIQQAVQERQIDLDSSTIYRILEKLVDLGLVCRTDVGTSGVVYELMLEDPHHHLVCLVCGDITRIPDAVFCKVRTQLTEDFHFQPRLDHMAVFGYCAYCQKQRDQAGE
jgi:Fur family transcriptional regulator, ferric uptake regulator